MENKDMVSIIVPLYNSEAYINRCVQSVLMSDYENWELILVDDGSTDCSQNICISWSRKDTRIRLISQQNGGPGKARNNGIAHANGKYIMFLDSDDFLKKHAISTMLKKIDDTTDLVQCLSEKVYGEDIILEEGPAEEKKVDCYTALKDYYDSSKPLVHYSVWGKLIRKSTISDLSFFETRHSEDVVFTAQLIARCRNIYYIPEYLYSIIERQGSLSRSSINEHVLVGKNLCADKMIELVQTDQRFIELLPRAQWNKASNSIMSACQVFCEKPADYKDIILKIVTNFRLWFYRDKTVLNLKQKLVCHFFCMFPTVFLKIYKIISKKAK